MITTRAAGTEPGAATPADTAAAPGAEDVHLGRLRALGPGADAAGAGTRRRGSAWQQPRRRLQQQVRAEGVAFRHWAGAHGLNRCASAACLGIAARTLRDWERRLRPAAPAWHALGRPVVRSGRAARAAVLELLECVGPAVGLAVLAGQFPDLPKAELADLLKRYRHVWALRHPRLLHVLHWQQPGAVWAIDYARPPLPLEGGYADLLAVRDLASGLQLLWLPVPQASAATTTAALEALFALYGAPLVLKLDNGPPFVAEATQQLLAQWQVVALYSPPGCPQYNGAIEAGIGALKVRTHYQAVRQGRPGEWTLEDTEAARQQANTLGRPWGAAGPTPAQRWAGRRPVAPGERQAFAASVACLEAEAAAAPAPPAVATIATAPAAAPAPVQPIAAGASAAASAGGPAAARQRAGAVVAGARPVGQPGAEGGQGERSGAAPDAAAQRRQAISRALVAHGYLLFTRRRLPPLIRKKKVT